MIASSDSGRQAALTIGYSVWASGPAIVACVLFGLAVSCLTCAAYNVPIPLPGGSENAEPPAAAPPRPKDFAKLGIYAGVGRKTGST